MDAALTISNTIFLCKDILGTEKIKNTGALFTSEPHAHLHAPQPPAKLTLAGADQAELDAAVAQVRADWAAGPRAEDSFVLGTAVINNNKVSGSRKPVLLYPFPRVH